MEEIARGKGVCRGSPVGSSPALMNGLSLYNSAAEKAGNLKVRYFGNEVRDGKVPGLRCSMGLHYSI